MTNDPGAKKSDAVEAETASSDATGERIAKVMARAGLCSRRDAEAWIADGRVTLNGKKLQSPAVNVQPHDDVRVDGKPLPEAEKTRLFRYYKPRGLVTTAKDPEGRPTVFDNLPEGFPRVISIGRLDLNSEGLLLLTNDGELARRLELPATAWVRRYRVRVNGRVDPASLARLAQGIEVEGVRYGAIEATLDRQQGDNAWLTMSLTEGKNREIRNVCAFFGWTVSRLLRLSYGPFQLGHLEKGQMEEVPGKVLRDQLGQPGSAQPLRPQRAQGGKARPPKPRVDDAERPRQGRAERMRDDRPRRDDERSTRSTAKPDRDRSKWQEASTSDRSQRYNEPTGAPSRKPREWTVKAAAPDDKKSAGFKSAARSSDGKADRSRKYAEPAETTSRKSRDWKVKAAGSGDNRSADVKTTARSSDGKADRPRKYAESSETTSPKPRGWGAKAASPGGRKSVGFKAEAGKSAGGKPAAKNYRDAQTSKIKPADSKPTRAGADGPRSGGGPRPNSQGSGGQRSGPKSGGSGKHAHRQRRP